jgi:hypothetical protein
VDYAQIPKKIQADGNVVESSTTFHFEVQLLNLGRGRKFSIAGVAPE